MPRRVKTNSDFRRIPEILWGGHPSYLA
jgi:hypothetical protein